jgi:hypothetical protein
MLDPALAVTWEEVDLVKYTHVDDRTIVNGSDRHEKWRIDLVREHGAWRVCGFEKLSP